MSSHPPADRTPDSGDSLGHLSALRLAALADQLPEPVEAAHLDACAICRAERSAHQTLLAGAHAERAAPQPRLTDWSALAGALRAEGLIATPEPSLTSQEIGAAVLPFQPRRARSGVATWTLRAAAGLLLAITGAVAGRVSAGADPLPGLTSGSAATQASVLPVTTEQAMAMLVRAEAEYRDATAFLAQQAVPGTSVDRPEVYQRRLAVMDEVAALTRAALYEAPHDPVLNQYYLASLGAREATLQQLGSSLPAGAQINRF